MYSNEEIPPGKGFEALVFSVRFPALRPNRKGFNRSSGGLGRKLLLTPSADPRRAPEKQTVGTVTVTASRKMLTLQALSNSLGGAAWAEERLLGVLRQSVPQNGRVHLPIEEEGRRIPEKGGHQKTIGYENVKFSKLKKLAILIPIRFDAPLGAAKEAPKRVPKQTGSKTPSLFLRKKLATLKTIRFDAPLGAAPHFGSVPTTPDPNTSEKVSLYKCEAYRDTNWRCI